MCVTVPSENCEVSFTLGPSRKIHPVLQLRALSTVTELDVSHWRVLAHAAEEPNPFQEPEFVLPLVNRLKPENDLELLTVTDVETWQWIAACVLQKHLPTLTRPLPHLRVLDSQYSFLDSLLIHRDHLIPAIDCLFDAFASQRKWHGVRIRNQKLYGPQAEAIHSVCNTHGINVIHDREWNRPLIQLEKLNGTPLINTLSKTRRKSLNRARKWLESAGPVSFRLQYPTSSELEPVTTFLRLESLGWKGQQGTSINSNPTDSVFFHEMIDAFAKQGQACFGELLVGDRVIASTCNLISGRTLFAFKLGWDPEFARGNPGHWSELELVSALQNSESDITQIDSCAQSGSYVESLANDSNPMVSTVYVWSLRAQVLCAVRRQVQILKSSILRSAGPIRSTPADLDGPPASPLPSCPVRDQDLLSSESGCSRW